MQSLRYTVRTRVITTYADILDVVLLLKVHECHYEGFAIIRKTISVSAPHQQSTS